MPRRIARTYDAAVFLLCFLYTVGSLCRVSGQSVMITANPGIPVPLGGSLTLTCSVSASGLTAISWTDDRVVGTSNVVETDLSTGISTLTVPVVLSADLGDYMCQANTADDMFSDMITVTANISLANTNFFPFQPAPPFYSGTMLILSCEIYVPPLVDEDTNFNMTVSYENDGNIISSDSRFTLSNLMLFGLSGGAILYRSTLTISPLVQTYDLGEWKCQVGMSSSNMLIIPAVFSFEYILNEQEFPALFLSIPTASVEPALVRVPDVYGQDVIFTCTGTVLGDLVVDKKITWLVDGVETTNGVSLTSSLQGMSSTSELQVSTPTDVGVYNYTCVVNVTVEVDPPQWDVATGLVNITGSASPYPPMSLSAIDVVHNAATIVWVVTAIAYTNESYVVRYGTDMNNLVSSSTPVEGGTNFLTTNQLFDVRIEGLELDTKYYFVVDAINSVSTTTSLLPPGTFTTLELPPDAPPSNFSVTDLGSTYIQFSWYPPPSESQNGEIISYTLNCTNPIIGSTLFHIYTNDSASFTSNGGVETNITMFSRGTMYVCTVLATNGAGNSPVAVISVTTIEQIPIGEPLNFTVTASGPRVITFSWKPPAYEKQFGFIILYTLSCESARDGSIIKRSFTTAQSSLMLNLFRPDTNYTCNVTASNSAGAGPPAIKNVGTPQDVPDATPTEFSVSPVETDPTMLMLSWRPVPEYNQNGMITMYIFRCNSSDFNEETVSADPSLESTDGVYLQQVSGLNSNTHYSCQVRARNTIGDGPAAQRTATTVEDSMAPGTESSVALITGSVAAVAVIGIVLVIMIIVFLLVLRGRQRKSGIEPSDNEVAKLQNYEDKNNLHIENEKAKEDMELIESHYAPLQEHFKPVPRSMFSQHVKDMHRNCEKGFEKEYASLPEANKLPEKTAVSKNRFANIRPYDFSRVELKLIEGQEDSDYINASYMDGYNREKAYIAAQGPMYNTVTDFWRMIVEHELTCVVMLTKCVEAGKRKCEQYWPENTTVPLKIDQGICIELISTTPYADFEMRRMLVTQAGSDAEPLEVIHWLFLGWPDHGVPKFATSLISFIQHVRHFHKKTKVSSPMLVHCSAGVGRTGTFILLDYTLERLVHEDTINIHEVLVNMRKSRVHMVQTLAQYVFVHDALDELITCGETDISVAMFKKKIGFLHEIIPREGITGFESQFKLLKEVCRKPLPKDCKDARQTYNEHKNRYMDRLPYDVGRPRLRPTGLQGAEYINASFIDGYKSRNAYIATQGPLVATIADFWRLIWEHKSKCMVMLCNLEEKGLESSALYWPEKVGEPQRQGNRLVVTLLEEEPKKDYIVRKLEVKENKSQGAAVTVTQFHFTEWPEQSLPASPATLLPMLEEVNKVQRTTGNTPITVMCNDGMGRTGTLICLHAQLERVKTEQVLDIFHFIKSARIQRANLVTTLEQYIFCHEVIAKFLETFDVYFNFK